MQLIGNVSTYFLAIDFEKNGLNMDPIFEVSIKLEAIEVTYHHVIALLYAFISVVIPVNFSFTLIIFYSVCHGGDYKLFQIQHQLHLWHDSRNIQIVGLCQKKIFQLCGRHHLTDIEN